MQTNASPAIKGNRTTLTDIWTVIKLIDWTKRYFEKAGVENPRLDAEWLLAEALGWRRIDLYAKFDHVPDEADRTRFREWVKRRADKEPVQQIIGRAQFLSLELDINKSVLIPRPETEHLVEYAVREAKRMLHAFSSKDDPVNPLPSPVTARIDSDSPLETVVIPIQPPESVDTVAEIPADYHGEGGGGEARSFRILDIGTGSGCIALGMAVCLRNADIVATDISPDAVELARQNAEKNGLADRITFYVGDLFDALPEDTPPFDIIVGNPPYIADGDRDTLPDDVACHEPARALFAGKTGLDIIERIIRDAGAYIDSGGRLFLEIGVGQADRVRGIFDNNDAFGDVHIFKDLAGIDRIVCAERL